MDDHYKLILDELRSDLSAAESEQEKLKLRCTQLQAALAVIEEKIEASSIPDVPMIVAATLEDARQNLFETMSMPEAIRHCLMNSPCPLTKRELMIKLRDGGKAEGNHFRQAVYNALYRMSKGGSVRRDDDGRWKEAKKPSD